MHKFVRNKYIIYISAFIVVFCTFFIPIKKSHNTKPNIKNISGDTLNCAIMLDRSMYSNSFSIGYFYDLFQKFSSFKECKINKTIVHDSLEYQLNQLSKKNNDFLVINKEIDSIPDKYKNNFLTSIPLNKNNNIVCVTTKDKYYIIQNINAWFSFFKHTPEYLNITNKYTKKYQIKENFGAPLSGIKISPYDNFVKKYAYILGWDWRLISSIMYQESKFKMGAQSKRGAVGLMQIKEDVAKRYNIEDIYDPEQNIKAGILHLNRIQQKYLKMGVDSANIVQITLAAYNCGEGRVQDCMNLALDSNLDPLQWEDLKTVIPLLRNKKYYSKNFIKFGKFNGTETLIFISNIMDRYKKYQGSVKK